MKKYIETKDVNESRVMLRRNNMRRSLNESKTTSLRNAKRIEYVLGFTFYKLGNDYNGNPLWCVKADDVTMDRDTARSLGFRSNMISDGHKKVQVWTCQSYSLDDTARHMRDCGVKVVGELRNMYEHRVQRRIAMRALNENFNRR